MSAISFPHHPEGSGSGEHDMHGFYPPPSSSFDGSSSFQMNPLSAHPPRTPRVSMVGAHSHVYGTDIYQTPNDTGAPSTIEEEGEEEEKESVQVKVHKIRKENIWREMLLTSTGRDKAFKLIQYGIRVYLLFHLSLRTSKLLRKSTRPAWEPELVKRLTTAMSGLSLSRKLLIAFNWLTPLTTIMAQQSVPFSSEHTFEAKKPTKRPLLQAALSAPPPVLLDLVNSFSDDIATFSKLGLLSKRTGDRAGRFSDWCWLIGTMVGLIENGLERGVMKNLQREVESRMYTESMAGATSKSTPRAARVDERELARLRTKDYWLGISRTKLFMDLIFVSYDIMRIKRAAEPVKAITGLAAAVLSSMKLYDRHKGLLLKAVSAS
ncbi:hypothetical protein FIBSPDRAFT_821974 [Athelia psychrophila]|uniref:Peroxisomal biogenesis factor 11 n=1 Tax=Athelia psychrophila TaxID=1759441 RepID=A0A166N547_9AGAM|nr:hypothetical protein FIBSPDRAFT_821974 [Fibularhizoctonia sp. CBS 109695]